MVFKSGLDQEVSQNQKRELVRIYVLDTNILLHEFKLVKKLSRWLKEKKWIGKIVIPYPIKRELDLMLRGLRRKKEKGIPFIKENGRDEEKLFVQVEKAMSLIEAQEKNPVWGFDRSKGTGIVPMLLKEEQLSSAKNPKQPSLTDVRALATAMALQDYFRKIDLKDRTRTRETRVYFVTDDRALKEMAKKYEARFLGTLKKLWWLNRKTYFIKRSIKRKIYQIRKKRFENHNGGEK